MDISGDTPNMGKIKLTCKQPTPWEVAIHNALNNTTCGIEPSYIYTLAMRELPPNETGRVFLKKNRYYKDE
jgi:hypothetical protein